MMHDGLDAVVRSWRDLEQLKAESERFQLAERVFYLHAPNGIGRSKLAASTEELLGVG
jgi:hypothetical protein